MHLAELSFEDLSHNRHRMFCCNLGGRCNPRALVQSFSGAYGVGSPGNGDAEFMRAVTQAALEAWHFHAVMFDLRELAYEWGDAIWRVFNTGGLPRSPDRPPRALVVSGRCRGG